MSSSAASIWNSPFGWVAAAAGDRGLLAVTVPYPTRRVAEADLKSRVRDPFRYADDERLELLREWLDRYLRGARQVIPIGIDLDASGATPLQRQVWKELCLVPRGKVITYTELALRVGRPGAARAIGQCVARNRWAIIVPCHRVVGAYGGLTGYAGGVELKRRLLELEKSL